jgi:hypothetical protein
MWDKTISKFVEQNPKLKKKPSSNFNQGSKSTLIYLWIDKEAGGPSRKSWVSQLMGG